MDNLKFCNAVCNCVKLFLCPTLSVGDGEERTGCAGEERTGCAGDLRSEMVWDQLERCWSQLLGNFTSSVIKRGIAVILTYI